LAIDDFVEVVRVANVCWLQKPGSLSGVGTPTYFD
jgi:hypothetical protein